MGTTKPRWDWLEEKHSPNDLIASSGAGYPGLPSLKREDINGVLKEKLVGRPELEVFGLAMLGEDWFLERHIHMVRLIELSFHGSEAELMDN